MKTISFYSYKGGTGRTLLAAHVARYLVGLGKRVVLVDFDFDAPGVPAIFGLNAFRDIRGGVVELVSLVSGNSRLSTGDRSSSELEPSIKRFLVEPEPAVQSLPGHSTGWLKLLPSGRVGSEEYWTTISSEAWLRLMLEPEGRTSMSSIFEGTIKPCLERLGADYLLVDSRAGITHYGGLARRIADREVIIFTPSAEAEHALQYLAQGLKAVERRRKIEEKARMDLRLPREEYSPRRFSVVVSRIPPELKEAELRFRHLQKWLKRAFGSIEGFDGVFPLHSDLHTHINPECRFPNQDTPLNVVHLHEDVITILASIVPELVPTEAVFDSSEERAHALWQFAFHRPFELTHVNRMFGLLNDRGEILNPDDATRNVAFKVDTFLRFLNEFYDGFERQLEPEFPSVRIRRRNTQEFVERTLEQAGANCGKAFGHELARDLRLRDISSPRECIKHWCAFDTRAGFGKLSFDGVETLSVENMFLWNTEVTQHRDFTAFFLGYANSVLQELLKPTPVDLQKISRSGKTMRYSVRIGK